MYAPEQPVGWQPTALIWPLAPPLYANDALLAAFRQPTALTWPLPPCLPEQPVGWQPTALLWPLAPPLYPDDAPEQPAGALNHKGEKGLGFEFRKF